MEHVSVGTVITEIKRRLSTLPRKRFLLLAIILFALGAWIQSIGLAAVRTLCDQIVADLGRIQPFGLIRTYLYNLFSCDQVSDALGDRVNCSAFRFLDPRRFLGSLLTTMADVWSASDIPGRILLPFALIAAFPIALISVPTKLFERAFGSSLVGVFRLVVGAFLTPFIASLLALVLQILAIALFWIFGAVVGLVVWLVATFGGVWQAWRIAADLEETARKMERVSDAVATAVAAPPHDGGNPG
jgi:ABC-type multidrug transport system fused ATPase/permease subunit